MLIQDLVKKGLIDPPGFVADNAQYLARMGSEAYGMAGDTSDSDIYGFTIPHKDDVFPHLRGEIFGFGRQHQRFEQWQQHHVKDAETEKEYDFSIYSIVKFFNLVMENNPNMVDSLFVPQRCVLHCTQIGVLVREKRHLFLHRGCWHKFKGYAFSQIAKMKHKDADPESKRGKLVAKHGYDTKFASHCVRLMLEVEQILSQGTLDLDPVGRRDQLKAIRNGFWTSEQVVSFFGEKEKSLEKLYNESKLPYGPDEGAIKALLLQCLEAHYGSLDKCVVDEDRATRALKEIADSVRRAGY